MHAVVKFSERPQADALVIPFWKGKKEVELACEEKEFLGTIKDSLASGDFLAGEGETLILYPQKGKEKRLVLLGLGSKAECLPDGLRRAYGVCVKVLRAKKLSKVNFLLARTNLMGAEIAERAIFEGAMLANYAFNLSAEKSSHTLLKGICFCGARTKELFKKVEKIISSVCFVRDLVNGNADDVHVDALKKIARGMQGGKIKTTILEKKDLEKEGLGLLLAVGRAATRDPALILLEYRGAPNSKELTALIGKGITYDTGGLNLKPAAGMDTMKCDMAGAASVLGTLRAAADLGLKKNLIGVLAVAENAIGPASFKLGDVYRSHAGKTVQITDTDAEGRLVLSDAISYVQEKYKLTRAIDIATLTGGVVVALGEEATGLFSNDENLAHALNSAGQRVHERLWRLPLYPEYKDLLKSSIADMKNSGPRKASASVAATFIQQFVKEGLSWAHLDVAGTAYLCEPKGYNTTLATGVGVRLLIDFLEHDK